MARKTRPRKGHPYLVAILFCDQVLEDKHDRVPSLIRVIDQVNVGVLPTAPPDFPSESNRILAEFVAFISFKSSGSSEYHTVRCDMESPSGKKETSFEQAIPFPADLHGGASLTLNMKVRVFKGGLFWLHVYLDGKHVGRAPVRIMIHRQYPEKSSTSLSDQE
jgi:hypothetical protein